MVILKALGPSGHLNRQLSEILIDPKITPVFSVFPLHGDVRYLLRLTHSYLRGKVFFGVGSGSRIPNLMSFVPEGREVDVCPPPSLHSNDTNPDYEAGPAGWSWAVSQGPPSQESWRATLVDAALFSRKGLEWGVDVYIQYLFTLYLCNPCCWPVRQIHR